MKKKKKKKKIEYICYYEDLKKWITWSELRDIFDRERKFHGHTKKSRGPVYNFNPLQQAIAEFFEEFEGYPRVCTIAQGHYLGLPEYLEEKGLVKAAKRCKMRFPKKSFLLDVNAGWKLYRLRHPKVIVPLRPDPKELAKLNGQLKEKKKKIYDYDTSSVIRRLGKEGYDAKEVRMILDAYGVECKDTTIKGQLWCGTQKGKYGMSANLNEWQLDQIMNALIETKRKNDSEISSSQNS